MLKKALFVVALMAISNTALFAYETGVETKPMTVKTFQVKTPSDKKGKKEKTPTGNVTANITTSTKNATKK